MRTYLFAALIALLHLILAVTYANITPYRTPGILMGSFSAPGIHQAVPDIGNPDERAHEAYVQSLLEGKGFPVFKAGDGVGYENHQPPTYYLLAAGFAKLVGASDITQPEGSRIRWLNGLVGAGTVLGVFTCALWGFKRDDVAITATLFAALLPMLCALDGAVSNDPLLYCMMTWTLAFIIRAVTDGWTWKLAVTIGVLTGLSLLTKTTALSLFPTVFIVGFLGKRAPFVQVVAALGVGLLVAAPWLFRNQSLYGDPFAMSAFVGGFSNPRPQDIIPGLPGGAFEYWTSWFGWWTTRSFFGAFGYMDIFLNSTGVPRPSPRSGDTEILYRILLLAFVLLTLGWVMSLKKPVWKEHSSVHIVNGIFLALVLVLFLRFNLSYFQAQGRYVIPAIGPIACGIGVGLSFWAKDRWKVGAAALLVAMLGLNLYTINRLPGEFDLRKASTISGS